MYMPLWGKKINLMCVNQSSASERYRMKGKEELLGNELLNGEQNGAFEENQPHRESFKGKESTREREVDTKTAFSLLNGSLLLKSKILLCCFLICMKLFTTFLCQHGENTGWGRARARVHIQKTNKKKSDEKDCVRYGEAREGEVVEVTSVDVNRQFYSDHCALQAKRCQPHLRLISVTRVCVVVCVKWAASLDHLLPLAAPATIRCVTWKRIPEIFPFLLEFPSNTWPWWFLLWHKHAVLFPDWL